MSDPGGEVSSRSGHEHGEGTAAEVTARAESEAAIHSPGIRERLDRTRGHVIIGFIAAAVLMAIPVMNGLASENRAQQLERYGVAVPGIVTDGSGLNVTVEFEHDGTMRSETFDLTVAWTSFKPGDAVTVKVARDDPNRTMIAGTRSRIESDLAGFFNDLSASTGSWVGIWAAFVGVRNNRRRRILASGPWRSAHLEYAVVKPRLRPARRYVRLVEGDESHFLRLVTGTRPGWAEAAGLAELTTAQVVGDTSRAVVVRGHETGPFLRARGPWTAREAHRWESAVCPGQPDPSGEKRRHKR